MPGFATTTIAQLIATCAVNTDASTARAVISVESHGNPLAIGVNGPMKLRKAVSEADAAQLARYAMARGYSVDLGLMQINSSNLARIGLTPETVFDPCTNIRAGTSILSGIYGRAVTLHGEGQDALRASLSAYNTGSMTRGFRNGYVARYYGRAAITGREVVALAAQGVARAIEVADPFTADSTVFRRKETINAAAR